MKIKSTKDSAFAGLKVLIYGASGVGKTRLCATTGDSTLIISSEKGLLSLHEFDLPYTEINTLQDLKDAYKYVANEDHGYKWICLDSISDLAETVLSAEKKALEKKAKEEGNNPDLRKAYGNMSDQLIDAIKAFRDVPNINIYFSAKMEQIKDELTGGMISGPMMPGKKLTQNLPYFFDEVFVLHAKTYEDETRRVLQTARCNQFEAKDRSAKLEKYMPADLSIILSKIQG